MRTISRAALERQLRREGPRLHLHPLYEDGRMFVAQKVPIYQGGVGGIGHMTKELRPVCSVSPAHPLRNVARMRRRRYEHDRMKMYRASAQRRREAFMKLIEPKRHTLKNDVRQMQRQLGGDALPQVLWEAGLVRPHAR